jgi:predicted phosphoadenosine phosphosulfate sulfurtransferase
MQKHITIVCFAGPSGSGKSELVQRLLDMYPDNVCKWKQATTRAKRGHGDDYVFMTKPMYDVVRSTLTCRTEFNCNQYRTNRLLKDADLKYRAIRICLPGDDPDIAFLEKHFTIKRDEEKIRRVERLVTAFEDSVRNRIRNHEMAAYKDSLAHRLFREAQEIRKQLDNPNSK